MFAVPFRLVPMAPALVRPPFHRNGWVYEEKVDGWRMLAYKDGPRVRLISRNAVDHTARFRELAAAIAKVRADVVVLDGEVAVFDKELVSRFHLLGDSDDSGILCTPPIYIGFDVLQVGRRDLRARPLSERRQILDTELDGHTMVLPCRRLPSFASRQLRDPKSSAPRHGPTTDRTAGPRLPRSAPVARSAARASGSPRRDDGLRREHHAEQGEVRYKIDGVSAAIVALERALVHASPSDYDERPPLLVDL